MFLAEARPRIAAELEERDENPLARAAPPVRGRARARRPRSTGATRATSSPTSGSAKVYSFHMALSYSRDPFCCFTTSMDLATFFDCHRRAFAHFGGVPGCDRLRPHQDRRPPPRRPGAAVPLHPEAAAFAGHYGFAIDVLAAYRPTGKGRVERQVLIVRDHVLAGRELRLARRAGRRVRRRGCRSAAARSTAPTARSSACAPRPTGPRCGRCRRARIWSRSGTCAGSGGTAWSPSRRPATRCPARAGPARAAGRGPRRPTDTDQPIHALDRRRRRLAGHPPAGRGRRRSWVVDPAHWDGLPDGHTRATTVDPDPACPVDAGDTAPASGARWRRC